MAINKKKSVIVSFALPKKMDEEIEKISKTIDVSKSHVLRICCAEGIESFNEYKRKQELSDHG